MEAHTIDSSLPTNNIGVTYRQVCYLWPRVYPLHPDMAALLAMELKGALSVFNL
jgi:hypothetical protein